MKLWRRVAMAKVLAPASQEPIHVTDDLARRSPQPLTRQQLSHLARARRIADWLGHCATYFTFGFRKDRTFR